MRFPESITTVCQDGIMWQEGDTVRWGWGARRRRSRDDDGGDCFQYRELQGGMARGLEDKPGTRDASFATDPSVCPWASFLSMS